MIYRIVLAKVADAEMRLTATSYTHDPAAGVFRFRTGKPYQETTTVVAENVLAIIPWQEDAA